MCTRNHTLHVETKHTRRQDYYCCVDALEFDCKLIYTNCALFNRPDSDIVSDANRIFDLLRSGIRSATASFSASTTRSLPDYSAAASSNGNAGSGWEGGSGAAVGGLGSGSVGQFLEVEGALGTVNGGGFANGGEGSRGGGGGSSSGGAGSVGGGGGSDVGRSNGQVGGRPCGNSVFIKIVCCCCCDIYD